MIEDPYQVLGVSPDATDDEIKQAYRRLAKKYHPDLHPGDEAAAQKMQQINAAYEQIKNPGKTYGGAGQYSQYDPFGGFGSYGSYQNQSAGSSGDNYQKAAYNYIRYGRYQEALNALGNASEKNARWYYLSALANNGLGNQVTALEHIRKAVSMDPDNQEYLIALDQIESGGTVYRRQAGNFGGFEMRGDPCASLCMCYLAQLCCCRGRFFCC